jgi:hypothetical protein
MQLFDFLNNLGFFELNKTVGRVFISSTLMCLFFLQKRGNCPTLGLTFYSVIWILRAYFTSQHLTMKQERAYVSCRPETSKKTHKFHSSQTRVTLLRCERSDWSCGNTWGQQQTMLTISVVGEQHLTWHDNHVNLISELDLGSWWTASTFGKGQQNVHNCIKQQTDIENHSQSPSLACSMSAKSNYTQNFHRFATTKLQCPNQSIDHCF